MPDSEEKIFEGVPSYDSNQLYEIELAKSTTIAERRAAKKDTESEEIGEGVLTLDVYRTPTEVVVESAIAGVNPEDIDIDITPDSITIKGERHRIKEVKNNDYDLQECYWGRFSRSLILPEEIDPDSAKADFENGILTIRMPKKTRGTSKKLQVKQK